MLAKYHSDGVLRPRCGSLASRGLPLAVFAADHPVVRSHAFQAVGADRGELLQPVQLRLQRLERNAPVAQRLLVVHRNHGGIGRLRRQQLVDVGAFHAAQRQTQSRQFLAPVAAQVPGHHQGPGNRIGRRPGFWGRRIGQQEFRRQLHTHRMCFDERIHAGSVGFQQAPIGGRIAVEHGLRRAPDAERAQELVSVDGGSTEKLCQPTGRQTPVDLHLPQAILRVQVTQRKLRIVDVLGVDVRHTVGIAQHFGFLPQAGHGKFTIDPRQAGVAPAESKRDKQQRQHANSAQQTHEDTSGPGRRSATTHGNSGETWGGKRMAPRRDRLYPRLAARPLLAPRQMRVEHPSTQCRSFSTPLRVDGEPRASLRHHRSIDTARGNRCVRHR